MTCSSDGDSSDSSESSERSVELLPTSSARVQARGKEREQAERDGGRSAPGRRHAASAQSLASAMFEAKAKRSAEDGAAMEEVSRKRKRLDFIDLSARDSDDHDGDGGKPFAGAANRTAHDAAKRESRRAATEAGHPAAAAAGVEHRDDSRVPDPIVPRQVPAPSDAAWSARRNCLLVRRPRPPKRASPFTAAATTTTSHAAAAVGRTRAAAFDLDNTLLIWRVQWPSRLDQYEMWSTVCIPKLRSLYDEGYLLVIFSNQGGIKSAFTGKRASKAKALVDWIAEEIGRPVCAVMSTDKNGGYHKPNPKMWEVCESECNAGTRLDLFQSFYVGDSAGDGTEGSAGNGRGDAYQDMGVDRLFAENVSELRGGAILQFHTPEEFFGESDAERRKAAAAMAAHDEPPEEALRTRAALLGGYFRGPVLLILCGAQGSGKSTFCERLCGNGGSDVDEGGVVESGYGWVHLSQDTIRSGKPGTREAVEKAALRSLAEGRSVVIDRMHLFREQRSHFVAVAVEAEVPAHAVILDPPLSVLQARVRERTDHPGGVQGERGARMVAGSAGRLTVPQYEEVLELVSRAESAEVANQLADVYRSVLPLEGGEEGRDGKRSAPSSGQSLPPPRDFLLPAAAKEAATKESAEPLRLPSVALGTQKVGKRAAASVVAAALRAGLGAVDTAPTYNNEDEVGRGLDSCGGGDCFLIVKVPKRAIVPRQVRNEIEGSLQKLGRACAELLVLHWPCDVFEAGSLGAVWSEMEQLRSEGRCCALGVSNFSVGALRTLLPLCKTARPAVNQIERHPLLPQWDVVDFCMRQGIVVQAHTPLGGGRAGLLLHPTVLRVAREVGRSAAQVLLGWNICHGVAVVVKAAAEDHVREVAQVCKNEIRLSPKHMETLDGLSLKGGGGMMRFVAPPFMYIAGAPYSWGEQPPPRL